MSRPNNSKQENRGRLISGRAGTNGATCRPGTSGRPTAAIHAHHGQLRQVRRSSHQQSFVSQDQNQYHQQSQRRTGQWIKSSTSGSSSILMSRGAPAHSRSHPHRSQGLLSHNHHQAVVQRTTTSSLSTTKRGTVIQTTMTETIGILSHSNSGYASQRHSTTTMKQNFTTTKQHSRHNHCQDQQNPKKNMWVEATKQRSAKPKGDKESDDVDNNSTFAVAPRPPRPTTTTTTTSSAASRRPMLSQQQQQVSGHLQYQQYIQTTDINNIQRHQHTSSTRYLAHAVQRSKPSHVYNRRNSHSLASSGQRQQRQQSLPQNFTGSFVPKKKNALVVNPNKTNVAGQKRQHGIMPDGMKKPSSHGQNRSEIPYTGSQNSFKHVSSSMATAAATETTDIPLAKKQKKNGVGSATGSNPYTVAAAAFTAKMKATKSSLCRPSKKALFCSRLSE